MAAQPSPAAITLLQVLNISTASCLAGISFSTSFTLVPRLLESPTPLLLQQWQRAYNFGKTRLAPVFALNGLGYFYLAWATRHLPVTTVIRKSTGYLIAGICTVGIIPYTLLVLRPTNSKLLKRADETKALGKADEVVEIGLGSETAHALVDWWGVLNLGRAVIGGVGALVGTWISVV